MPERRPARWTGVLGFGVLLAFTATGSLTAIANAPSHRQGWYLQVAAIVSLGSFIVTLGLGWWMGSTTRDRRWMYRSLLWGLVVVLMYFGYMQIDGSEGAIGVAFAAAAASLLAALIVYWRLGSPVYEDDAPSRDEGQDHPEGGG